MYWAWVIYRYRLLISFMKYLVYFEFAGLQWGIAGNVTSSLCHSRGRTCEAQGSEQVLTGKEGGGRKQTRPLHPLLGLIAFLDKRMDVLHPYPGITCYSKVESRNGQIETHGNNKMCLLIGGREKTCVWIVQCCSLKGSLWSLEC